MRYRCLRCDDRKELRKGRTTGNNAARYFRLEKQLEQSKIVHLHKRFGLRNLCLKCLAELVAWQVAPAAKSKPQPLHSI
jgi:hypothetical protein